MAGFKPIRGDECISKCPSLWHFLIQISNFYFEFERSQTVVILFRIRLRKFPNVVWSVVQSKDEPRIKNAYSSVDPRKLFEIINRVAHRKSTDTIHCKHGQWEDLCAPNQDERLLARHTNFFQIEISLLGPYAYEAPCQWPLWPRPPQHWLQVLVTWIKRIRYLRRTIMYSLKFIWSLA